MKFVGIIPRDHRIAAKMAAEIDRGVSLRERCEVICLRNDLVFCSIENGYVVFPGGGVQKGEELGDAVRRETMEEADRGLINLRLCGDPTVQIWPEGFSKGKDKAWTKGFVGGMTWWFTADVDYTPIHSEKGRHSDFEEGYTWHPVKTILDQLAKDMDGDFGAEAKGRKQIIEHLIGESNELPEANGSNVLNSKAVNGLPVEAESVSVESPLDPEGAAVEPLNVSTEELQEQQDIPAAPVTPEVTEDSQIVAAQEELAIPSDQPDFESRVPQLEVPRIPAPQADGVEVEAADEDLDDDFRIAESDGSEEDLQDALFDATLEAFSDEQDLVNRSGDADPNAEATENIEQLLDLEYGPVSDYADLEYDEENDGQDVPSDGTGEADEGGDDEIDFDVGDVEDEDETAE